MRIAVAFAVLFAARFAAAAFTYPLKDADIAWQRWLGDRILTMHALPNALGSETFTAAGAPWTPQEWLLGVGVASAMAHGAFVVLAALAAAIAAVTILLVALRARTRGASILATGAIALCSGLAMLQSFGVRAQLGGWFCLALFLLLIEIDGAWSLAAIAVAVLWANVHASVLLAPAVAGLWTVGALVDNGADDPSVRRGLLVTIGSALATCASPLGYHLPVYAIALMESPIRSSILEWKATAIGDAAFSAGVLPMILLGCVLGLRGARMCWRDLLPWLAGVVLSLAAVRNIPIAAILMGPPTALLLSKLLPDRLRVTELLRERAIAGAGVVMTLCGAIVVGILAQRTTAAVPLPFAAIASAQTLPGTRKLYCEDFAWCSLALGHHSLQTFLDGRCDPFPPPVWQAYLTIEKTASGWRTDLARFGVDTILAARNRPLAAALASESDWRVVWRDQRYMLFARD